MFTSKKNEIENVFFIDLSPQISNAYKTLRGDKKKYISSLCLTSISWTIFTILRLQKTVFLEHDSKI